MLPHIISGGNHKDHRGELKFNNSFNMLKSKDFTLLVKEKTFKKMART